MIEAILYVLYAVLLFVFVVGVYRLRFALKHFRIKSLHAPSPTDSHTLPSVTVCIPARNEDHAMTECLERVIANNYPKLEIIVLDDMSGDDTSVLIKSFASAGVRFVEGSALPSGWLGKNHALQGLLDQASGSYILYMDVDTRIEPDSIEKLVYYALREKATMVSVLPRREDGWRSSVLFSPLRYFWETTFHRKDSPATASNAWLIERQWLIDMKGFDSVKLAIQPESKLSAQLMADGNYRFLIGDHQLGISFEKKWRSQIDTSIRLLYPLLGAKIVHGLVALLDLLILASPLLILISGLIVGWGLHQSIAAVFWLVFAGLYGLYLKQVWRSGWWLGALLWPVIVIQEAITLVVSMVRYKQRTVTWKGRSVKVEPTISK